MTSPSIPPVEEQVVAVAREVLAGSVGVVDGCRRLVQLFGRLADRDDQLVAPIIAVESETEDLPLGDARSLWSPAALAARQREVDAYVERVRGVVLEVCDALVQGYSGKGKTAG